MIDEDRDAVHRWFELSYAQYLTVPRSVLQSMPLEWQERFVRCLEQLDDLIDWRPPQGQYRVTLHLLGHDEDEGEVWGPEINDPLMNYERGRRRIPWRETPPLTYGTVPPDWPQDWGFPVDGLAGVKFRVETHYHELVGHYQELHGFNEAGGQLQRTVLSLDYPYERRADETPSDFLNARCHLLYELIQRSKGVAATR